MGVRLRKKPNHAHSSKTELNCLVHSFIYRLEIRSSWLTRQQSSTYYSYLISFLSILWRPAGPQSFSPSIIQTCSLWRGGKRIKHNKSRKRWGGFLFSDTGDFIPSFPSIYHLPWPKGIHDERPSEISPLLSVSSVQRPVIQIWSSCYTIFVVVIFLPCPLSQQKWEPRRRAHLWLPSSPFGLIQKPLSSIHHPLLTVRFAAIVFSPLRCCH